MIEFIRVSVNQAVFNKCKYFRSVFFNVSKCNRHTADVGLHVVDLHEDFPLPHLLPRLLSDWQVHSFPEPDVLYIQTFFPASWQIQRCSTSAYSA